jgi:hypothetical protein
MPACPHREVLRAQLWNRCRLLALSLIPADNQDLDWTTVIYADPQAQGLVLNLPLWTAHIDALLKVRAFCARP